MIDKSYELIDIGREYRSAFGQHREMKLPEVVALRLAVALEGTSWKFSMSASLVVWGGGGGRLGLVTDVAARLQPL